MSDAAKTALQRVLDGDRYEKGDLRDIVCALVARIEDLESAKPVKAAPKKATGTS